MTNKCLKNFIEGLPESHPLPYEGVLLFEGELDGTRLGGPGGIVIKVSSWLVQY